MNKRKAIVALCVGAAMTAAILGAQKLSKGNSGAESVAEQAGQESAKVSFGGFEEGVHFEVYEPMSDRMESLTILFRYGCPVCQQLHPKLVQFEQDNPDISVSKAHLVVNREDSLQNAMFHLIATSMTNGEAMHNDYFSIISNGGRTVDRTTVNSIIIHNGNEPAEFWSKANPEFFEGKLRPASEIAKHYEALGVPTIIVNGKYRLKNEAFGGFDEFLEAARVLAEQG